MITFDDVAEMQRQLVIMRRRLRQSYVTVDFGMGFQHHQVHGVLMQMSDALTGLETATQAVAEMLRQWPVGN